MTLAYVHILHFCNSPHVFMKALWDIKPLRSEETILIYPHRGEEEDLELAVAREKVVRGGGEYPESPGGPDPAHFAELPPVSAGHQHVILSSSISTNGNPVQEKG